eukprot:gene9112-10759_t
MYKRVGSFSSALNTTKTAPYSQREVVIVEEQSFPTEGLLWNSTTAEKRHQGKYNIDWAYRHVSLHANIAFKVVYVSRDLYQTAASITTQPNQFRSRVDVSKEFASYLEEEYKLIQAKKADIWAQVSYENVVYARNCSAMVAGMVEFMQWTECDVEYACFIIQDTLKPQPIKGVDAENYEYSLQVSSSAAGANDNTVVSRANPLQLSIPLINISDTKPYPFTTYVSDRKPFSFTPTPASKTMSPKKRAMFFGGRPQEDRLVNFTSKPINTLSYLYIVGVEGVGHHGVTPVLASIAKTCNYHVLYENGALRTACNQNTPNRYKSLLNAMKRLKVPNTNKTIIIEDQSFPTDNLGRNTTAAHKKNITSYNLEWIYNHTNAVNVNAKFIHLTRDFYRSVASHPEFDFGFQRHADVLHAFLMHINAEYLAINQLAPNLWTEVDYESFTHMKNCTALVSAVINFLQWDECDVDFACDIIKSTVKMGRNRTVNAEHFAYAQSFNTTLSIPKLDIQPTNVYNFSTVVSERKPFSFIHNMTRNRGMFSHQFKSMKGINSSLKRNASSGGAFNGASHATRASNNNVSLLYVVGVDGSANADVSRTLTRIAQACQYHVLYKHKALWRAQSKLLPRTYVSTMESIAHSLYQNTNKLLILEDTPVTEGKPASGAPATAKNNLAWVHDRLTEYKQATSRFLYVHRPLSDVLSSAGQKGSSVELQSQLIQDSLLHIHEEYKKITAKGGVWAQAEYEWFASSVGNSSTSSASKSTEDANKETVTARCVALVTALVEFAGWSECDVADACSRIEALSFTEKSVALSVGNVKNQNVDGSNDASADTLLIPLIPYKVGGARS